MIEHDESVALFRRAMQESVSAVTEDGLIYPRRQARSALRVGGRSITRVTGPLTPQRIADSWLLKSVPFTLTNRHATAYPARSASLLDSLEASLKG